jgi:hypothetical protein
MSQLSKQEIAEAEALLKRHRYRVAPILDEVLQSYQEARAADRPCAAGWTELILQPVYHQFRAAVSRTGDRVAIADLCLKCRAKFRELATVPPAERQGRAAIAQNAAISTTSAPIAAFNADSYLAMMAGRGASFAVAPDGSILARGPINERDRQLIHAHRDEIAAALARPMQKIA